MKQLTGVDTSFLNLETGSSFGHVNSLSIYGWPSDDPDFDPYTTFRARIEAKLGRLEPLTRRLVEVPLGLDRPYWINDPDFDIDFHVRHIGVPGAGGPDELGDLVGRLIGRPMDRDRPLWECYVIEGLASGDFAVLLKMHHATIDGAAGALMLAALLDPNSDPADAEWSADSRPSSIELLARTAYGLARTPVKGIRLQAKVLNEIGRVTRRQGFPMLAQAMQKGLPGPAGDAVSKLLGGNPNDDEQVALPRLGAPRTPFNASITPHRRFAYRTADLGRVKAIKGELGSTVNDVVMSVCAGALRRYLEGHDALPDQDLVAMIPVSIRTGDEEDMWSNRVSAIFSDLPTTTEDPVERVSVVNASMGAAKRQHDMLPAESIMEMSDLAPPALAVQAARLAARVRIADRTRPPANLVISNVPGSRAPLGMRSDIPLKHYYPVSTIVDGQGLNITVQSYCDQLDFGLVACRELVPDVWDLADLILDEIEVLAEAVGV
ncbi:MAG: wax ester/triacylglycerol synthase family O-acyltransferase [Actinomycetota bacterium]